MVRLWRVAVAGLVLAAFAAPAAAQSPCEETEGFHALDFWLGEWDVLVGERKAGENRIESVLSGCAVVERWTGAEGGRGMSLFTYNPITDTWKQVWVTEDATRPGGLKEKTRVETTSEGGAVFRGEIATPDGGSYLDRTILTPQDDGTVRQVIQVSTDDGATWRTVWDATYRRAEP